MAILYITICNKFDYLMYFSPNKKYNTVTLDICISYTKLCVGMFTHEHSGHLDLKIETKGRKCIIKKSPPGSIKTF